MDEHHQRPERCLLEPSDPKVISVAAHPKLAYGCSLATHGVGTQGNTPTHPSSEDSGLLCCVSPTQARGKPQSCSSVPVQIGKLRLQGQVWHSLVQNVANAEIQDTGFYSKHWSGVVKAAQVLPRQRPLCFSPLTWPKCLPLAQAGRLGALCRLWKRAIMLSGHSSGKNVSALGRD